MASKCGVKLALGECNPPVRTMKRGLRRRKNYLRKEPTGSRVSCDQTKAKEGVQRLERQPRRTQRRRGHGTVEQPLWEQERPASAPTGDRRGASSGMGGSDGPYKWPTSRLRLVISAWTAGSATVSLKPLRMAATISSAPAVAGEERARQTRASCNPPELRFWLQALLMGWSQIETRPGSHQCPPQSKAAAA